MHLLQQIHSRPSCNGKRQRVDAEVFHLFYVRNMSSVGASAGSGEPKGQFADLIMAAIKHGDVVLVVETHSEEQTAIAREVIAASVGEFKDLNMLVPVTSP